MNANAMNILFCTLDSNEFNKICTCELAKEIWDKLETIHEGINHVKESKISMLIHDYEFFKMDSHDLFLKCFLHLLTLLMF